MPPVRYWRSVSVSRHRSKLTAASSPTWPRKFAPCLTKKRSSNLSRDPRGPPERREIRRFVASRPRRSVRANSPLLGRSVVWNDCRLRSQSPASRHDLLGPDARERTADDDAATDRSDPGRTAWRGIGGAETSLRHRRWMPPTNVLTRGALQDETPTNEPTVEVDLVRGLFSHL